MSSSSGRESLRSASHAQLRNGARKTWAGVKPGYHVYSPSARQKAYVCYNTDAGASVEEAVRWRTEDKLLDNRNSPIL